ncbi:MAG: hypothetical protein M3O70_02315 [Actinomycetota bacterium]|nr:hypothetical protein [Actinomycetota bacterium]
MAADRLGGGREVVLGPTELHVAVKENPERASTAVGHSHTAHVDDPVAADSSVELHVGVSAHDHVSISVLEHLEEILLGCGLYHDLRVVPGSGMAEQHRPEAVELERDRGRQLGQPIPLVARDLLSAPLAVGWQAITGVTVEDVDDLTVGVASHGYQLVTEAAQLIDGPPRHRAGRDVPTAHDQVRWAPLQLVKDRPQRRCVAVDV